MEKISMNLIEDKLEKLVNCLEEAVGFNITKLEDKIRISTPFLYSDNDHIELFIFIKEQEEFIYISDSGLTVEKFFEIDKEILLQLSKFIGISFNEESLSFYKKIKKLNKTYSLLRRIIDFSNHLQKLEILYMYLNIYKTINIQITHNIYIKSNKDKINKFVLKKIKKDINKDLKKVFSSAIKDKKIKIIDNSKNNKLTYNFKLDLKK